MNISKKLKLENEDNFRNLNNKGFLKYLPKYAKILGHNN